MVLLKIILWLFVGFDALLLFMSIAFQTKEFLPDMIKCMVVVTILHEIILYLEG